MIAFDLPGAVRRIRRRADLSQRQLADACGLSQASIAQAETGRRGLSVDALSRLAARAGLRLALLDDSGGEAAPMSAEAVRDGAGRRFPAHLDTRHGDEDWWHGRERYSRQQPWYTFDRARRTRDVWRERTGMPDDHQLPEPGDSPADRRRARQAAARRRRGTGEVPPAPEFECSCPDACDALDDWTGKPVHAVGCPCRCDIA